MAVATIVWSVAGCAGLGTEVQAMAAAVRTGSTARATRLRVRPTPSLESGFIVGRSVLAVPAPRFRCRALPIVSYSRPLASARDSARSALIPARSVDAGRT